ncbi:MAG: hypothetical protein RLN70_11030 [Rhodospirillaceae bacterium]
MPAASEARMLCAPHAQIVEVLEKDYQERKVADGLSDAGALVELFLSDRRSWTIVFTIPGGPSCVLSTGEAWEIFWPAKPSDES